MWSEEKNKRGKPYLRLSNAVSTYRTKPKTPFPLSETEISLDRRKFGVPRSLHTEYAGWVVRAMRETIKFARENKYPIKISWRDRSREFQRMMEQACREERAKIKGGFVFP